MSNEYRTDQCGYRWRSVEDTGNEIFSHSEYKMTSEFLEFYKALLRGEMTEHQGMHLCIKVASALRACPAALPTALLRGIV